MKNNQVVKGGQGRSSEQVHDDAIVGGFIWVWLVALLGLAALFS